MNVEKAHLGHFPASSRASYTRWHFPLRGKSCWPSIPAALRASYAPQEGARRGCQEARFQKNKIGNDQLLSCLKPSTGPTLVVTRTRGMRTSAQQRPKWAPEMLCL